MAVHSERRDAAVEQRAERERDELHRGEQRGEPNQCDRPGQILGQGKLRGQRLCRGQGQRGGGKGGHTAAGRSDQPRTASHASGGKLDWNDSSVNPSRSNGNNFAGWELRTVLLKSSAA